MAFEDVNFGGVLIGAAAVTGLVAAAMTAPILGISLAAANPTIAYAAAASAGGVLGHWATKVTEDVIYRVQKSATDLVQPR